MTGQILFVQGGGEGTHGAWDKRLVESLERELAPNYVIRYPRMPDEADPSYFRWQAAIEAELTRLDDGAILVGHSVGGTILVNALAANSPKRALGAIVLIAAPFVGPGGWPSSGEFQPRPALGADLPAGVPVLLFHGSDDDIAPVAHADLYAAAVPQAILTLLEGRDHQLNDDLSDVAAAIRALG